MVGDIFPNQGALGGLYTALRLSTARYVLCAACDMPCLNLDLLRFMIERTAGYDAVISHVEGYWQVFPGLYSQSCIIPLERAIEHQQLHLQTFLSTLDIDALQADDIRPFDADLRTFANINAPFELAQINQNFILG
jgi:molybdenum cofactor guanylyltransferase